MGKNKPIILFYFEHGQKEYINVSIDKALITLCNKESLRVAQSLIKLASDGLLFGVGIKGYPVFLGKFI